jgi:DnaJ-class molecular chaperone
LGLDRDCTDAEIRAAYRLLAKQQHPDVNPHRPEALSQTQQLNAAYEVLSDPGFRRAYDSELARARQRPRSMRATRAPALTQDIYLRIDEFFRGTALNVRVNDPGNAAGPEVYSLTIPPNTAPGTRFKMMRTDGSKVVIRARARPDHRFKARGSDLRCDLRISWQRAAQGGTEFVIGPTGARLRLNIPRGIARAEVLRISGEGLPKSRGGRGDLLVRVIYRPEVRIARAAGR